MLIRIESGKSFKTKEYLANAHELGVIKVSAVTWFDFRPEEAKAIDETYEPAPHHRINKGDVLISRANTRELVGAVVFVHNDFPNRLLSDKTLRLVIDDSFISPLFLVFSLRVSMSRVFIEENATGTSDSMRNISQDTICAIPLLLPPIEEQKRIEKILVLKTLTVKKLIQSINEELESISLISEALLRLAFSGEL